MDLSCPSFLLDQLEIKDETSEYGSRETSDSESTIGGLCLLQGYHKSQGDKFYFTDDSISHLCLFRENHHLQREPPAAPQRGF